MFASLVQPLSGHHESWLTNLPVQPRPGHMQAQRHCQSPQDQLTILSYVSQGGTVENGA